MEKYLTYFNTVVLMILVVVVFTGSAPGFLGAAPSTATTFYDINLDNANGIGGATIYANGNSLLSPTTLNVATINATTLTATGTTVVGCQKVYQLNATTLASTTYYLVASTSIGGAGVASSFPLFATSTKPAFCP